jgi:hypothetical protein
VRTAEVGSLSVDVRACCVGDGGRGLKAGKKDGLAAIVLASGAREQRKDGRWERVYGEHASAAEVLLRPAEAPARASAL